ncbi:hydrogen gas-evolving membrane-bound hydrogenase subunit E [Pontivivens insulae]|uniref:Na(+)/H(+) antiporter subunit A n=1 Tax=Pontivivens insulae TaxID=1639689 RepID=A0A2R8A6T4_9RHOB|nr:hydrogen gas-evolving membrane-bound hydrogenase subunit E [Pontivivens insulae]RED17840.1 multisubunit sodium/proton antiporter MrpA subunit [Pontivivens insulae]SPF27730.1 Na(+)/H(+) antiporter subunit A [Pontivivens insulae]
MTDPTSYKAGLWRFVPATVQAILFGFFCTYLAPVSGGQIFDYVYPWVPALGIEAAFRVDALSLLFALLITGIGAICFLYAASYFEADRRLKRLLTLMSLFAAAMLGLVLADDAITLFVAWEMTTLTSFLLVGFDHQKERARYSAQQALLITGIGGLALMAGLILMGEAAGTYRISEMGDLTNAPMYLVILLFIFIGAFTKSAQFPFHFWLPGAMAAPTPVSAYLHSATMVKAGVYLIARLSPQLGGTDIWIWTLTLVGAATMVVASFWALRQTDLKLMLAWTTLMGLGALMMGLGGGSYYAVGGALTFIVVHAFYKAALFLTVGLLDKGAGTREADQLSGLRRAMPRAFIIAMLAGASMAGLPPFVGFIGKELIYEGALQSPVQGIFAATASLIASALMIAAAGMVAIGPFFGEQKSPKEAPKDPSPLMWVGPGLLAVGGLLLGLFPQGLDALITQMTQTVRGEYGAPEVKLWHGVNTALFLSLLTFALGALFYRYLRAIQGSLIIEERRVPDSDRVYDILLNAMKNTAAWTARTVQDGRMMSYLRVTFITLGLMVWAAIFAGEGQVATLELDIPLFHWVIVAITAACTITILFTGSRLIAIAALGGVGAAIAVIFVLYSAIDVAMTQLLVEILIVAFVAIAFIKLPRAGTGALRIGDAIVASVLGLGVTFGMLAVQGADIALDVTEFFEQASYPEAAGRNVVNVILVDFRALDTLGEVAVVVIAGIAALAALRAGKRIKE